MVRITTVAIAATSLLGTGLSQTTSTPTATLAPTPQENQTSPSQTLPAFEIDIVYPLPNVTYNFTGYIPLVFSFRNLSAATKFGGFKFIWGIMPYGTFERPSPGGIYEDERTFTINETNVHEFENADGSPFLFVNATNTTRTEYPDRDRWQHPPTRSLDDTYVYALQYYLQWDKITSDYRECRGSNLVKSVFFHLKPESRYNTPPGPNPEDLGNLTTSCPQFGSLTEMDLAKEQENVCLVPKHLPDTDPRASPCAVKIDDAMVSSISSRAAFLAKPTETETETSTVVSSTNAAAVPTIPVVVQPVLAAIGLLAVL